MSELQEKIDRLEYEKEELIRWLKDRQGKCWSGCASETLEFIGELENE